MKHIIISLILVFSFSISWAQTNSKEPISLQLTLDQAIELAQRQSLSSFRLKNMYLSSYWSFRSYKASKLPSLRLNATPLAYTNSVTPYEDQDGTKYRTEDKLVPNGSISLGQNITPLGGYLSLESNLNANINLKDDDLSTYRSTPITLSYQQNINGYNRFKWQSKIEPAEFEKAKKTFIRDLEVLNAKTVNYFFSVLRDEINLSIAEINYSNADTLYRIGKGRFEIGTVTQDELLDLELGVLNSKIALTKAKLHLDQSRISLNSFLLLEDNIDIKCIAPAKIPDFKINVSEAISKALENNPQILEFEINILKAKEHIASTYGNSGLSARINAGVGYSKRDYSLESVYARPYDNNNNVSLTFSVPLVDWGERKGKIQMARFQKEMTEVEVKQDRRDFEQDLFLSVAEFNIQEDQVMIAAKADTIAQLGYNVTKQRFLIDKVDVIKLNSARNSQDAARRNYIESIRQYWNYYYNIRQLTLFDFENKKSLIKDLGICYKSRNIDIKFILNEP